ncbi:MAG: hypothetical protein ACR2FG_04605 [Marmoricola sp.]
MRRELSGAVALVRGLGLVLEARSETEALDPRAVRAVQLTPDRGSRLWHAAAVVLCLVGGTLGFLTWPNGGTLLGDALCLASLVVIAPVLWGFVRSRVGSCRWSPWHLSSTGASAMYFRVSRTTPWRRRTCRSAPVTW